MALRGGLAAVFFLGAAIAFWSHRVYHDAPHGPIVGYQDLFLHALPTTTFLHNELQRGHLPLWNPYQMAGEPFLGLYVTAALYPPNVILTWLLPPERALEALAVFHLALAGFFTWLLGGRLGLSPPARLAAAAAYMLAPTQLHGIYMVPGLNTLSWLPAIFWAIHGLVSEARPRWAIALATCFTLSFLGGYAAGIYYILIFTAAYGVFGLAMVARRGTRLRVVGLAALGAIVTFGLSAPQLLPTAELTAMAVRGTDAFTYAQGYLGSFRLDAVVQGALATPTSEKMQQIVTLPALALPLALCGGLARRLRAQWGFFLAAAVIAAAFMLGPRSPVYAVFYALPMGAAFRGPWQMGALYHFLAALLVGLGIEGLRECVHRRYPREGTMLAAALALAFLVLLYGGTVLPVAPPVLKPPYRGGPPSLIETIRAAEHRGRLFVESMFQSGLAHKIGMSNGIFAVPDYESNMPAVYERFLTPSATHPWQGHLSLTSQGSPAAPPRVRALDLMSVRFYATPHSPSTPPARALARIAGAPIQVHKEFTLYERTAALPRTYVVESTIGVEGFDAALERVLDPAFRPASEAVVSDVPAEPAASAADGSEGSAEIVRYETDEVEIAAECARPCLLVLTDLHYPGWQARVDGRAADILRTNAIFRGVRLEPGAHRVTFAFRPASFRLGVLLMTLVLAAGCVVVVGRRVRRHRLGAPAPSDAAMPAARNQSTVR